MAFNTVFQQRAQCVLDDLVQSGQEVGLQVAAYLGEELIVDAWSGVADEATGRLIDGETLFTTWSTTKGFVATCVHLLAERGQIDYDAPIASYWPEFAAHGKELATVRHALTHMAGVPHMPADVTPEQMTDWDAMCAALASTTPLWQPGAKAGYHAWTFGWLLGEIVRRVDGRPLAQFAREALCAPLGIHDFYLGIPDVVAPRVATLRQSPEHLAGALSLTGLARQAMPPNVTTAEVVNRPDFRRACIPGGGGIMNARAIARHYAMLANGGALGGTRLLSQARIAQASVPRPIAYDELSGAPARMGLGYGLGGPNAEGGDDIIGHGGNGGSQGFADPSRRLSFGLAKTLMTTSPDPRAAADYRIVAAIRAVMQ